MTNRFLRMLAAPWANAPPAPSDPRAAQLRDCVEAGNQDWVDGLKSGDAGRIVAAYEKEGVNCLLSGDCLTGRAAIARHYAERIASLGRATWAEVRLRELVRDGDYAYEWGRAEARFAGGGKIEGRYLTAWRRQDDGSWRIFRNVPLP